ncbi:hypothetical protein AusDCA_1051 [Desulfitobacterium sp. AusDCA]
MSIKTHEWVGNGAYEFLLIKCTEFDNQKLLSFLDVRKLARQNEIILASSLKKVDNYVNDLCVRASFLGNEIPEFRKSKAINILKT